MRKIINQAIRHPLISGSAIIVIGSMTANIFNYLYNLGMGRLLTVSEYGILASLISLFNIFVVFSTTITTVFSKFSAAFAAQNKKEFVGVLFKKGNFFVGGISFLITLLLIFSSSQIADFLHLQNILLINLIAVALFFTFLASLTFGILQGLLKFFSFSLIYLLTALSKFLIGVGLVILGFRLVGAVAAILIATIIGYLFAYLLVNRFLRRDKMENFKGSKLHKELLVYGLPVFLSNIGLTMIYTMDIILVKHFFSDVVAGQYAALSLMGRSIFFIVLPIISVAFPLIAQKKERNENLFKTVLLSISLIGIPSVVLSLIYFIFPKIILAIFFPAQEYAALASYLGPFSIFILFFTLSFFFINFYLSIGKTRVFLFTIAAAIVEIIFIIFFHSNILQIVIGLTTISFLLLTNLLLYYLIIIRKDEKRAKSVVSLFNNSRF